IREHKNYPMLCQSLQAVAAYRRFDWNTPEPFRRIFRARMFDFWRKLDVTDGDEIPWYTGRSRFNSQIPLEYAYAAWQALSAPPGRTQDPFAPYLEVPAPLLTAVHARPLGGMEPVNGVFSG